MSDATKSNGAAVASMVLGICSIALCWTGWIGLAAGIVAVILAVVAKNKIKADADLAHSNGKATAGLITGIIGTVISAILVILALMFVAAVNDSVDEWEDAMEQLEQYD